MACSVLLKACLCRQKSPAAGRWMATLSTEEITHHHKRPLCRNVDVRLAYNFQSGASVENSPAPEWLQQTQDLVSCQMLPPAEGSHLLKESSWVIPPWPSHAVHPRQVAQQLALLNHVVMRHHIYVAAFAGSSAADALKVSDTESTCVSCLESPEPCLGPAYSLVPLQHAHTSAACARYAAQRLTLNQQT